MSTPLKICLVGASGRMGQEVIAACRDFQDRAGQVCIVLGGIVREGHAALGTVVPGIQLPLTSHWIPDYESVDVIVDFSSPEGSLKTARTARGHGVPVVIGTTGLTQEARSEIAEIAEKVPVLFSSNTSRGVTVLKSLTRQAATMLGSGFDAEVIEIHHRMKKDAPSGTALELADVIADSQGETSPVMTGRNGHRLREDREIGVSAVRGGDVTGEHSVLFLGDGERITISHSASGRSVFAHGALRGACWLATQSAGLYSMEDVVAG